MERHVAHAEAMAVCLPDDATPVVDLGSGGGVPGLVLATGRPGSAFVLLDARQRRTAFLRDAVERLGLAPRVEVVEERAEVAARRPGLRGTAGAVVARAFGPPPVTAECAVGFLRVAGVLVVSEPPEGDPAGRWPGEALEALGLSDAEVCRTGGGRFVRLTKTRDDDHWPRRVGIPAKRPLWAG